MNNLFNQNIEYKGVNRYISNNVENFTQFNVSYVFKIGNGKKNISSINKAQIKTNIIYWDMVDIPRGISLEGQCLTGKKVILCGDLNLKIEYLSNQNIEVMHIKTPISVSVSIDYEDYDFVGIYPSFSVEDIYCRKENDKEIYVNATLVGVVDVD